MGGYCCSPFRSPQHAPAAVNMGNTKWFGIDLGRLFVAMQAHLLGWAKSWLVDIGLSDVSGIRTRLGQGLASDFQTVAGQILNIGQGTLGFFLSLGVMVYPTFFLLRDEHGVASRIERKLLLADQQRALLIANLVTVICATIKGITIAALRQGTTGGIVF